MLTVGQFARMARLSAKQLRSYDALGLLSPARVDPDTGYRYYHPGQLRTALTIALLRSLDVPLAAIHELLTADPDRAQQILAGERARIADELAARERTLRALGRLTAEHDLMPYEVTTVTEPPRRLLALHGTTTAERLHGDAAALVQRLTDLLPWAAASDVPVVGLYPLDLAGEVAFSVGAEPPDRALDATGDEPSLTVIELPGGPVARVIHVGAHDELPLAYFPLLAWLQERGHPAAGPIRERYLDDPATTEPEHLRTEISLRLRDIDQEGPPPR